MTLEELRYHRWEPISVTLDQGLVSRYVPGNDAREVPAEVFLNLECQRVIDTLLGCSKQVLLASSSLDIKRAVSFGMTVDIDTRVSALRTLKEQSFVTIEQTYSMDDQTIAVLTQVLVLNK